MYQQLAGCESWEVHHEGPLRPTQQRRHILLVFIGNYWYLLVIFGHYQSCLVIVGHFWSLLVMLGNCWSLLVMLGHYWSHAPTAGRRRQPGGTS